MRFKQYLTELFQEKTDFETELKSSSKFIIRFEVDDELFYASAVLEEDNLGNPVWEIAFSDSSGEFNVTGLTKEGVFEVFSYVISFIKYFIKQYNPETMYFEPWGSKQEKLYKKLIKRYSKEMEKIGYKVQIDDDLISITRKE